MSRIISLLLAGSFSFFIQFSCCTAELDLVCNVVIDNFNDIKLAVKTAEVKLNIVPKNQLGGAIRITQTKQYEFWVMTYALQSYDEQPYFINSFQVAIRDKSSGLFMHALSDVSHSPANPPHKAHISLLDYYPGEPFLEKGGLSFECVHIE